MKLILVSDIHITNKQPKNRIDNYQEAQYKKIAFMLDYSKKINASAILVAGDFFDSAFVPDSLKKEYIRLFNDKKDPSCVLGSVFGQHDLLFHSLTNADNTPLAVLLAGVNGVRLSSEPIILENKIAIYGMSWDEEVPKIKTPKLLNILVAHITVISNKCINKNIPNAINAKRLLMNHQFDIWVTGDNHERFFVKYKDKYLFNNGSVMRKTIDQADFKPSFTVLDVSEDSISYELVYLPIKKNVFKERVEIEKEQERDISQFFRGLTQDAFSKKFDFLLSLKESLKSVEDKDTKVWVSKIIDEFSLRKS